MGIGFIIFDYFYFNGAGGVNDSGVRGGFFAIDENPLKVPDFF